MVWYDDLNLEDDDSKDELCKCCCVVEKACASTKRNMARAILHAPVIENIIMSDVLMKTRLNSQMPLADPFGGRDNHLMPWQMLKDHVTRQEAIDRYKTCKRSEHSEFMYPFGMGLEPLYKSNIVSHAGDVLLGFVASRPLRIHLTIGGQSVTEGPRGMVSGFRYAYLDTYPISVISIQYHEITMTWENENGEMLPQDEPKCIFVLLGTSDERKRIAQAPVAFMSLAIHGCPRTIIRDGMFGHLINERIHDISKPVTMMPSLRYNLMAIVRLQRTWRRCISDPSYLLCQRRLLREFHALQENA